MVDTLIWAFILTIQLVCWMLIGFLVIAVVVKIADVRNRKYAYEEYKKNRKPKSK